MRCLPLLLCLACLPLVAAPCGQSDPPPGATMTLIFDNSDTTLAWVVWLYPDGDAEAVQAKTVPPLGVVVFDVRTVAAKIEMVAVCVGTNHRLAGDFPVTDRAVYTVPLRAPPILPTP